jgi:hypothetical protein
VRSPRNVRSNAAGFTWLGAPAPKLARGGKRSQIALRLDVENLRTLYRHMISLIEVTFMNMGVRDKHKSNNRDSKRKSGVMTPSLP